MKIIIKIPTNQEQIVKDAFTAYSNLNPDQTENIKINLLTLIKTIYIGMVGAKEIAVIAKDKDIAIADVPATIATNANKLTITTEAGV
jgi:hypothetical protein